MAWQWIAGPVALFTKLGADFRVVHSERDPECRIWEQKWTECRWCPLEYFEAFRDRIPGRDHGNGAFAVDAASGSVQVTGLPARTTVSGSDTRDQLHVSTGAGDDSVAVSDAAAAAIAVSIDLGVDQN